MARFQPLLRSVAAATGFSLLAACASSAPDSAVTPPVVASVPESAPNPATTRRMLYAAHCGRKSAVVEQLEFDGASRKQLQTVRCLEGARPLLFEGGESESLSPEIVARDLEGELHDVNGDLILRTKSGSRSFPEAKGLRAIRLRHGQIFGIRATDGGESVVSIDRDGRDAPQTPVLESIESFDISPDGGEVVVAARRGSSLDVALSSVGGLKWIGSEPLDERGVTWAPRGSKVSFLVDSTAGTLLRTIHIPTSSQLTVDLGPAMAGSLVWDRAAERVAFWIESPMFSPRLDSVRYGGEERRTLIPSERVAEMDLDFQDPSTWVAHPRSVRYNERHPAVVWSDPSLFRWSGARADAHARGAGVLVTARVLRDGDDAFWEGFLEMPWPDAGRVIVVGHGDLLADRSMLRIRQTGGTLSARRGAVDHQYFAGDDPDAAIAMILERELSGTHAGPDRQPR